MGDVTASGLYFEGDNGGYFEIAEKAAYQLTASWLVHVQIRFEQAPQLVGFNMVFGQQNTNMNIDGKHGWGVLYWDSNTGDLMWGYTEVQGGNNVALTTWINVPVAGPFPITVDFTAALDDAGTLHFYNGNVVTERTGLIGLLGTGGIYANPWRFAKSYFGPHGESRFTFNNFSFFNTVGWTNDFLLTITQALDDWVVANEGKRLYMSFGTGLVAWAELVENQDARTTLPVKYPDGTVAQDVVLTKTGGDLAKNPVNVDSRAGPQWHQNLRWGGPIILNVNSVRYSLSPTLGRVTKRFELGSRELTLPNFVAQVERQVKEAQNVLRKTAQDV